jgi:23S rRNA pseudouridine955/2504/2580 synthase
MIISKNHNSARLLTTLFRLRKIHKTYLAVCHGHISKKKGELKNELITFENNKKKIEKAITYYKVLSETDTTSFLELKPVTGRKHQLRKQLAIIDNPIVGDKKYILSNKKIKSDKDLMLHAYSLKFYINNKKFFYKASPPAAFNKYLNKKNLIF